MVVETEKRSGSERYLGGKINSDSLAVKSEGKKELRGSWFGDIYQDRATERKAGLVGVGREDRR